MKNFNNDEEGSKKKYINLSSYVVLSIFFSVTVFVRERVGTTSYW